MWWMVAATAAEEPGCTKTSVGALAKSPLPTVIVLGERKGTLPDLSRARAIVKKLAARGPVTLALQAVNQDRQEALDRIATGLVTEEQAPAELEWADNWGFPFEAYAPLLVLDGVKPVAIGAPYTLRPEGASVSMPPGYFAVLADPMGNNPVPPEMESRYAEFVAWADLRMAEAAISAWDGQGALVILVDRYHVEGGLGVQWQAARLTDQPVAAALLADAGSLCYPGDQVL